MSDVVKPILKDETFERHMTKQNALLATMVRQNTPAESEWVSDQRTAAEH